MGSEGAAPQRKLATVKHNAENKEVAPAHHA
jgi:hypothetical protein